MHIGAEAGHPRGAVDAIADPAHTGLPMPLALCTCSMPAPRSAPQTPNPILMSMPKHHRPLIPDLVFCWAYTWYARNTQMEGLGLQKQLHALPKLDAPPPRQQATPEAPLLLRQY